MGSVLLSALVLATLAEAPPASINIQEVFNTASEAANKGNCQEAVPMFENLERHPSVKPGSLPAATISARKGTCLIRLGRREEGERAILAGLPVLENAGADFRQEVSDLYTSLGDYSYSNWDYRSARERYEKALSLQSGTGRIQTLAKLSKATMFEVGSAPIDYADEGLGISAGIERSSHQTQSSFYTLRGRALLNRGRAEEAYADLKKALDLSGGLTLTTTLDEASMRSDLALAALILGKEDQARKYMAYTGAGRISESPFASAVAMSSPDCGTEAGLDPDDFAVVEFSIADDGSVESAHTIYTRGSAHVAAAFARAVKGWYWRPEDLAKIPTFYRVATRVEVRCSAAGGGAPGVLTPLFQRYAEWAEPLLGLNAVDDVTREKAIDVARAQLENPTGNRALEKWVAAVGLLAWLDPRMNAQTVSSLDLAIAKAQDVPVPGSVINALNVVRVQTKLMVQILKTKTRKLEIPEEEYSGLLSDSVFADDALGSGQSSTAFGQPWRRILPSGC